MTDAGLPLTRTAFIDREALSALAESLHCPADPQAIVKQVLCLSEAYAFQEDGNRLTVSSGNRKASMTVLETEDRAAYVLSGDQELADTIAGHIRSASGACDAKPLTLLTSTVLDSEEHASLVDLFTSLLPAIEQELSPYIASDARPTKVTITFADGAYMVDRALDSEVLGCFFVRSENEQEDAMLSDCGFEVILNMRVIADELMDADSEKYLMSMVSTLPHEIIHALNFANASRGLTPLEAYDCGLLNTVRDHYMQMTFGSAEKEEQFTELTGLLIAKKLCTPNIIRQMAQVSASHEPEVRALCRSLQKECE